MHIHILGICGTFMGGLALLAKQLGHDVSGSDVNIYPPMSTQLELAGIEFMETYSASHLKPAPDLIIIGNTLSRGNECVEYVLDHDLNYLSGPQWLAEQVLQDKHVLAVAGTHGKTTTTSILSWLLKSAGKNPGFLIGGFDENFGRSAQLGKSNLFVVEADEYDTAFFDKRSKFIHYRPRTLIINNIEYDHADIFADIGAIRREFHHLVRIMPASSEIIIQANDAEIERLMAMGCWTPVVTFGIESGQWSVAPLKQDFSSFQLNCDGKVVGAVDWSLIGRHNASNAIAAIVAARHVGVEPAESCHALAGFKNVKRRLQRLACINGITVYDDFAHHPTAIQATLTALRENVGQDRIITILEPRSNTMKMGIHKQTLAPALLKSDMVRLYQPANIAWQLEHVARELDGKCRVYNNVSDIIEDIALNAQAGDHIVIMSNGAFENIHHRLIDRLQT